MSTEEIIAEKNKVFAGNIDEFTIGEFVIDTKNTFGHKKFKFIEGDKYDVSKTLCEILDKTQNSILVKIRKFAKVKYDDDGSISKGIDCWQWFTMDEYYFDNFNKRFKKQI